MALQAILSAISVQNTFTMDDVFFWNPAVFKYQLRGVRPVDTHFVIRRPDKEAGRVLFNYNGAESSPGPLFFIGNHNGGKKVGTITVGDELSCNSFSFAVIRFFILKSPDRHFDDLPPLP